MQRPGPREAGKSKVAVPNGTAILCLMLDRLSECLFLANVGGRRRKNREIADRE